MGGAVGWGVRGGGLCILRLFLGGLLSALVWWAEWEALREVDEWLRARGVREVYVLAGPWGAV